MVVPGAPALARGLLPLTLTAAHNPPPSLAGVFRSPLTTRFAAFGRLRFGLIDAQRRQATRLLADGAMLANLLASGLLVGGSLGVRG